MKEALKVEQNKISSDTTRNLVNSRENRTDSCDPSERKIEKVLRINNVVFVCI